MAFGAKSKDMAEKGRTTTADGEQKVFENQWMPTGQGIRNFYMLPALNEDGTVKRVERRSPNTGKVIKRDGKPLIGLEEQEETVFVSAWWPVMVDGELRQRRLMFHPDRRFDNPLARLIDQKWPRVSGKDAKQPRERSALKLGFAMNIWDVSPVQTNEKGQTFYQSGSGKWDLLAYMNNGKIITDKDQLPEHYDDDEFAQPLFRVRILEGSYGKAGGKHLFQDFNELYNTTENPDGIIISIPEVMLKLTTTGTDFNNTRRTIRATANFKVPDDDVFLKPRYDLAKWTEPWPDDAIEQLLAGEDYNDIVAEFGLTTFPTLEGVDDNDEGSDFD